MRSTGRICPRTGAHLLPRETLALEHDWNGDYLVQRNLRSSKLSSA